MEHENNELATREQIWAGQEAAVRQLLRLANEPALAVYGPEALTAAVAHKPAIVRCIDERISSGVTDLGSAGSSILQSPAQRQAMAQKIRAAGLTVQVSYHENCGAAGLFCQRQKEATGADLDPLEEARRAAQELMATLGLEGQPIRIGYSSEAALAMTGEPGFHHARAVIIDGTGRFDPAVLGLPAGFLVSGRYAPDDTALAEEVSIAQQIALGNHGFGDKFTAESPLALLLVGAQADQDWTTEALKDRLGATLTAAGDRALILPMDL